MSKMFFYYGAMNSSKTANMLMAAYNYRQRGSNIILITPDIDTRVAKGVIASRIGLQDNADIVLPVKDKEYDLFSQIKQLNKKEKINCVITDETQFFSENIINQLRRIVDELDINVICYGLKVDFKSHLFEGSKRLLEVSDDLREVKTVCDYCDRKAILNLRTQDGVAVISGNQVKIGGNDSYVPVCSIHYYSMIEKAKKIEAKNNAKI